MQFNLPMPGLPVKPLVYVRRVWIPLEEQYKYLGDESSSEDEEWTEGPIRKKEDPTASKGKLMCQDFINMQMLITNLLYTYKLGLQTN